MKQLRPPKKGSRHGILPATWSRTVVGHHLQGETLRQNLRGKRTLLVFLRHLGCPFCREVVHDLKRLTKDRDVNVLFFHPATLEQGEAFFKKHWPEVGAIADPQGSFYKSFKLEKGTPGQLVNMKTVGGLFRAMSKGHLGAMPAGNPLHLTSVHVVEDARILWNYAFKTAGESFDFETVIETFFASEGAAQ